MDLGTLLVTPQTHRIGKRGKKKSELTVKLFLVFYLVGPGTSHAFEMSSGSHRGALPSNPWWRVVWLLRMLARRSVWETSGGVRIRLVGVILEVSWSLYRLLGAAGH